MLRMYLSFMKLEHDGEISLIPTRLLALMAWSPMLRTTWDVAARAGVATVKRPSLVSAFVTVPMRLAGVLRPPTALSVLGPRLALVGQES